MDPDKMTRWLDQLEIERRIWVARARTPEVKQAAEATLVDFLLFRAIAEEKHEAIA